MDNTLFRKKIVEKISSPEQLTDYLRVTNPSIWVMLSVVVIFIGGLVAWASVGTLSTSIDAKANVNNGSASIVVVGETNTWNIEAGMPVEIAGEDCIIMTVDTDEYGRVVANTKTSLEDGIYDSKIVVENIHPIQFLVESR